MQDSGMVSKDHLQETAHRQSNGYVTDDVTWPWEVKVVTPNFLRLHSRIPKEAEGGLAYINCL